MKSKFKEFFIKEDAYFSDLSDDTIVVFDTCTLLNVCRLSKDMNETFLQAIKKIENNIWIPYHVGLEFNLKRISLMDEFNEKRKTLWKRLDKLKINLQNDVNREINNTFLDEKNISQKTKMIKNKFSEDLDVLFTEFTKYELSEIEILFSKTDEDILSLIDYLDGKVGDSLTEEEMKVILQDGVRRYALKLPPGFEDSKGKKGEIKYYDYIEYPAEFGDLIIWKQIINKAKEAKIKKVIFVTDDSKKDWWNYRQNEKIGARLELKKELLREAEAELIMLDTNLFLQKIEHSDEYFLDLDIEFDENYFDNSDNGIYNRQVYEDVLMTEYDILIEDIKKIIWDITVKLESNVFAPYQILNDLKEIKVDAKKIMINVEFDFKEKEMNFEIINEYKRKLQKIKKNYHEKLKRII